MRLPLEWLHEYCDPGLEPARLAERLALTGTEVDRIHHHGVAELDRFVVGKVLSAERHPDADRLTVCSVDVGHGDGPAQIVCGAKNVAAGQTVAVARPGAVMPDGSRLGTAKLRGVASAGMILAEDELAIGVEHWGIMVLADELAAGSPLADVLPISTEVLELEITPNRPDCLAVYGVAREVHAATGAPLAPPPWGTDPGTPGDVAGVQVAVECPDLCPRFTARAFEAVTIGPSPEWLKARLMAAGQRPINNVVDITNYVMLLTGQPLHAFDLDRVEGGRLVVRRARDGEEVQTLDGLLRTLDEHMVVIDDAQGPTSIAGVMGGGRSEVSDATTRVLMEAATWNGPNILRTSNRLQLRSEASARFEKQLSPGATMEAQAVAHRLMVELCGARPLDGTIDVGGAPALPPVLHMRDEKVERLLGAPVARARSAEILTALGFTVDDAGDGLDATVPHFRRTDVTREADLVEEVARIDGLDKLPETLPSRRGAVGVLAREQRLRRRAEDALVGLGLYEVVGWSFTSAALLGRLGIPAVDRRGRPVAVANPMSEEQAVMRTTLLGSLLDSAGHNARHGTEDVGLFEVGAVYLPQDGSPRPAGRWDPPEGSLALAAARDGRLPDERQNLGALLTGSARPASWRESAPPRADHFAAKGVLEGLATALRVALAFEPAAGQPFLHPGRAATVLAGDERVEIGWVGELHPSVAAGWDLDGAAAFEIDLGLAIAHAKPVAMYEDLTSFPAVRQDLAVVVPDGVGAAAVLDVVRRAGGKLLEHAEIFDVYRGEQVGEGRVSLAVRLAFRAGDRTLADEDVSAPREKIVAALRGELGGELRG